MLPHFAISARPSAAPSATELECLAAVLRDSKVLVKGGEPRHE